MPPSLAQRLFGGFAQLVCRFPLAFVLPQLVLVGLCAQYAWSELEFRTQRNDLVEAERSHHRNFLEYRENFQSQDDILVMVESGDPEKNRQFVERLGARLEAEPELFASVFYKGNLGMLGSKALYFVEDNSVIGTMEERLREARPLIESFAHVDGLEPLLEEINLRFRTASDPSGGEADWSAMIQGLEALERILVQAEAALARPGLPPSPGVEMLFAGGAKAERERYITFQEGRVYLVTARPVSREEESKAIDRMDRLVAMTRAEVPGVNAGITGAAVLSLDEMRQSQKDTLRATVVTILLVLALFAAAYREFRRPLMATLCLLAGISYTLAFTTLAVGHLNILTIAFLPMLVGLAIDFGIHLVTRYEEELDLGLDHQGAMSKAMVRTGQGILTSCLTTAGAFFAMTLTGFKGIREMGIITSGGLLLSLYPMMTILPALLLRFRGASRPPRKRRISRSRIEALWLGSPARIALVASLLAAASLVLLPRIRFDYNLLNMQSPGLPSVQLEMRFLEISDKSVLFALVIAGSLEEARALEAEIAALPTVSGTDSLVKVLDRDPPGRREAIERLREAAADLEVPVLGDRPVDLDRLSQALSFFQGYLTMGARHLEGRDPQDPLIGRFRSLKEAAGSLQRRLDSRSEARTVQQLGAYLRALSEDVQATLGAIRSQDASGPPVREDLPGNLRDRFIGRGGQHLIQVYPVESLWEREHQEAFLAELRALAARQPDPPVVTGTPVQLYEYTGLLKRSYQEAALYALGVIVLLLLIHFRSPRSALLALVPVLVGTLWLAGLMGLMDIPFNPANIMTLPLVAGIGVSSGIHILNRYREERHTGLFSKSTGKGVLVSGLTTMAGFGSLCLAHHRGIQSLGLVMTLGVLCCLVAALALLPSLLQLLDRGKPPPPGERPPS